MAQQTATPTAEELRSAIFTDKQNFMKNAVQELGKLEQSMKSGQLSQGDYLSLVQTIIPEVRSRANRVGLTGSHANEELKRQGINDFKRIQKDFNVYKSGHELLGRDLTEKELTQIRPRFGTGSPEDVEQGQAYIAELAGVEERSPQALAKKAPQFSGQVNETFKSLLGRDASASESDYYGRLLATGEISPYEVEQYVKSGQEYQGQQDKAFRGELAGELEGYRDEAFGDVQEDILSRYQKMGGGHKSSNLDFALAEAAKDLQGGTEQYLSGISASQYGGNKATARADYENMLSQYLEGSKYARGRSDSYMDMLTNRAFESKDYQRQMQDYLNFLNAQPKQKGNKLQGAFSGAASMAATGNPFAIAGGGLAGYLLS